MPPFKIEWEAPEFEERPKTVSWYWISIIVAVFMLAFAIWEKNFLFGLFVVIAELLIITWANRTPERVGFLLNEKGLTVPVAKHYPYSEFEHFSIDEGLDEDPWGLILFVFKRRIRPALRVHVPKTKIKEITPALRLAVREVPHEETLVDAIERFLRF